jgi:spoIIIJ-associated protein
MKSKKEKEVTTESLIKEIVDELLQKLEILSSTEIVKVKDPTGEENYQVKINTEESGLLIGRHGETINSLQLLTGVILYKKTGIWHRVVLNVGDYREAREESIKQMTERIVSEVETTGQSVVLPPLTPYERRLVHMMLSESKTVTSESIGEGKDRRLTIKPR